MLLPNRIGTCKVLLFTALAALLGGCLEQADEPQAARLQFANQAPYFVSPNSWEVSVGDVSAQGYGAKAVDDDGDPVSYSLSPDDFDAQFFHIDAQTGDLRFAIAPDANQPQDESQDNQYDITLIASDGQGGVAELGLQVTVQNPESAVEIQSNSAPFLLEQEAIINVSYDAIGVIYTARAVDPEGDPIVYSIKYGGLSPSSYAMDAITGQLSLVRPPPRSLEMDSLVLVASDGQEFHGALHIRFHEGPVAPIDYGPGPSGSSGVISF